MPLLTSHRVAAPLPEDGFIVLGVVAVSPNGSDPTAHGELVMEEGRHNQRIDTRHARLIAYDGVDHFLLRLRTLSAVPPSATGPLGLEGAEGRSARSVLGGPNAANLQQPADRSFHDTDVRERSPVTGPGDRSGD